MLTIAPLQYTVHIFLHFFRFSLQHTFNKKRQRCDRRRRQRRVRGPRLRLGRRRQLAASVPERRRCGGAAGGQQRVRVQRARSHRAGARERGLQSGARLRARGAAVGAARVCRDGRRVDLASPRGGHDDARRARAAAGADDSHGAVGARAGSRRDASGALDERVLGAGCSGPPPRAPRRARRGGAARARRSRAHGPRRTLRRLGRQRLPAPRGRAGR